MTIEQKRLQKLSRILRKISEYDEYIHTHYNAHEVMKAFEKGQKKKSYYGYMDGLIYSVWSEADNIIMSEEAEEE